MLSCKLRYMALSGVALLAALAACTATTRDEPGANRSTRSDAVQTTWTDGKPAFAITCDAPDGCQARAQALCNGNYTTLKSENMPSIGTRMTPLGPPSVVVRCGG
jgi:hypothetical protein